MVDDDDRDKVEDPSNPSSDDDPDDGKNESEPIFFGDSVKDTINAPDDVDDWQAEQNLD